MHLYAFVHVVKLTLKHRDVQAIHYHAYVISPSRITRKRGAQAYLLQLMGRRGGGGGGGQTRRIQP